MLLPAMYLGFAFEKMPINWNPTREKLVDDLPNTEPPLPVL
jgi:hypothetical protein